MSFWAVQLRTLTSRWSGPFGVTLLALGLFVALAYTTMDLGISSPNERSRLYLTVSMFESHSYRIDPIRSRFGPVFDEARFAGHYFTDKAPGASVVGLVPYAALRSFVDAEDVTLPMLLRLVRYGLMVPIGVASFFVFRALGAAWGIGRTATHWAACAWLLATPAFHYSAAFFGHQIVALCLLGAMWLIEHSAPNRDPSTLSPSWALARLTAAGALTGLAAITEYQAMIGVLGMLALVAASLHKGRFVRIGVFALGGLPFAAFLAHYHTRCFGGPFELSYQHLANPALAKVHGQGLGGVLYPTFRGLWGTLLSHHRGVVTTSPFMILALPGVWALCRRGACARTILVAATILLHLLFVAASSTWEAGWGFGSRLLLPILPLMGLLVAAALDIQKANVRAWLSALANSGLLVGVASFQCVTALFAEPPNTLMNPWLDVVLPLAAHASIAPNLGALVGLRDWWSLLPLVLIELGILLRAARGITGDQRTKLAARPLWLLPIPALMVLSVLAAGPSGSERERADFVNFVLQMRAQR